MGTTTTPSAGAAELHDALIDDFGLYVGRAMGWPPVAGRLAGVLMLSEVPMTMTELQKALGVSKGSVSETTRLLITSGTVRRYKPTGSRQFVYQWREDAWVGCLRHVRDQTAQLKELAQKTVDNSAHLPPVQRGRMRDMHDYYVFLVERMETLLVDYQAQWEADHVESA